MRTTKYTTTWTIKAMMLHITQSTRFSVCAITLASGRAKPSRLSPSAIAAPGGHVLADQFELVVGRDARVDEQIADRDHEGRAEVRQKCRQARQ